MLWANVVCNGVDLITLQKRCGINLGSVTEYVSTLTTMETAWLVSGLAHEYNRTKSDEVKVMLMDAACELTERRYQAYTQTVAHTGKTAKFSHSVRRWIANFADQIYTIQALAFVAMVTGDERARNVSGAERGFEPSTWESTAGEIEWSGALCAAPDERLCH